MLQKADPTLDDVCDFIVDCMHTTSPTQNEGYPSIRTPNVGRGRLVLDGVQRVSEEVYRYRTTRGVPEPGDLILAREAPAGNIAIIKPGQDVCLGQRTVHLRPNRSKVDPDFLCYFMLAPLQQGRLLAGETGATAGHVNMRDIRRLPLEGMPSLAHQRSIGRILSDYDDLLENNRRRITLLEEAVRQLYKEWFVRFRFPGHEHVKIVDGVPKGWERKSVAELTSFLSRGITPTYDEEAGGLIINQKCIRESKVALDAARHQSKSVPDQKLVRKFDVLINSTGAGTLGRVAQNFHEVGNLTVDSHVTIARPSDEVPPVWFGIGMTLKQDFIATLGRGATNQTELSKEDIGTIAFNLPSHDLRMSFEDQAAETAAMIVNLAAQNDQLARARDLLLPKLMSGAIAV